MALYSKTFEDGIVVLDRERRFIYVNHQAASLAKRSARDLIGKNWEEVFPETIDTVLDQQLHRAFSEEQPLHFNFTHQPSQASFRIGIYPSDDSVCLVFRDTVESQRIDQVQAELAAIVTSSEDAIISKTLEGRITSWNDSAERMFGYTAAEAIGQPIIFLMPTDRVNEERDIIARLRCGERIEPFETVRRRKDGREIHVSLSISPIKDGTGTVIGAAKIVRNITGQKQTAEALKTSEERYRALARNNETLYREAKKANRLKDEFLATMSHELRTPLHAILGWVRLIRSKVLDEYAVMGALETVERNAMAQAEIVEDLLDVSRIITGKLRLDMRLLDVNPIIHGAVEAIALTADNKGVEVQVHYDPRSDRVTGDEHRLHQVLWNVLSNAVKFTPQGGRVTLQVRRVEDTLEIIVSDTGEGIDPEFLPHVFDRFRQGGSMTDRRHGGLGLGLAIVRHLVELHGGTVEAQSRGVGQGATFIIRLPAVMPALEERTPVETAGVVKMSHAGSLSSGEVAHRLQGKHFLVVEDNADSRHLLVTVLQRFGATVTAAASVPESLGKLNRLIPDMILSDIAMPGVDGYSFVKKIRSLPEPEWKTLPVIAVSACARKEEVARALAAGYDAHLAKPFGFVELVELIEKHSHPRNSLGV